MRPLRPASVAPVHGEMLFRGANAARYSDNWSKGAALSRILHVYSVPG